MRHFYSGGWVSSPCSLHVYVHKCYWRTLIGCCRNGGRTCYFLMGRDVDMQPRRFLETVKSG